MIAMSSDNIQSEYDFYRRQIALPRLDIAISERAWVKRELDHERVLRIGSLSLGWETGKGEKESQRKAGQGACHG